jgi:polyphosphate kinase
VGRLLAVVQVPQRLPRLVPVPADAGEAYALLEEIVAAGAGDLFPGHAVVEAAPFRLRGGKGLFDAPGRIELCSRASSELEGALAGALRLERAVHRLRAPL